MYAAATKDEGNAADGCFSASCRLFRMAVMLTLRKRIAGALENEPLDVREISQRFHLREKEVLDHLQHIARSVRGGRFIVEPASCERCGFSFKKRERLSKPSRCPVCRSEQILPPRFQILSTSTSGEVQNSRR
jgi:predicted Zn-ribbon and HTH transcriptional regulator